MKQQISCKPHFIIGDEFVEFAGVTIEEVHPMIMIDPKQPASFLSPETLKWIEKEKERVIVETTKKPKMTKADMLRKQLCLERTNFDLLVEIADQLGIGLYANECRTPQGLEDSASELLDGAFERPGESFYRSGFIGRWDEDEDEDGVEYLLPSLVYTISQTDGSL